MFEVNNFYSVSIVDFEQVNICWASRLIKLSVEADH